MREFARSSPLLSIRRLVVCLGITLLVVTTDVLFIHVMDIRTAAEFATEVAIFTLGFYGGLTLSALLNGG